MGEAGEGVMERKSQWELFLEEEENPKPKEKQCSKCREYKSLSEYHKGHDTKQGVKSRCKRCRQLDWLKYRNRVDRFWKFYHKHYVEVGGCLEWTGACDPIPRCRWNGKKEIVTRLVYRLTRGELPDDMYLLHTCNNQRCVRQSHLRLGTRLDLSIKVSNNPVRGEQVGTSKLTEADVRSIRQMFASDGLSKWELASRFGVCERAIRNIIYGRTWTHVDA